MKPTRILSADELRRLLETARLRAQRFYPLILFLADTRCRLGEALALRWSDLDVEARTARITRSFSSGERLGPTKAGRGRVVELSSRLCRTLAEHMPNVFPVPEEKLAFRNTSGGFLFDKYFRKVFSRVVTEAIGDCRHHTPHDLRHTWASLHMARGTPMKWIQEQGGWTTPKLLLETYGHFMLTESRGFSEALAALDGAHAALGVRAATGMQLAKADSIVVSGSSGEVLFGDRTQVPNHAPRPKPQEVTRACVSVLGRPRQAHA